MTCSSVCILLRLANAKCNTCNVKCLDHKHVVDLLHYVYCLLDIVFVVYGIG